jgi:hypothetical protein
VAVGTMLAPRLKASADAAYLPHVEVTAVNHHYLRGIVSPSGATAKVSSSTGSCPMR